MSGYVSDVRVRLTGYPNIHAQFVAGRTIKQKICILKFLTLNSGRYEHQNTRKCRQKILLQKLKINILGNVKTVHLKISFQT